MNLDLARIAHSDGPEAFQNRRARLTELAADLTALSRGTGTSEAESLAVALTKPTVLRRLAALMAHDVPASAERLVGVAGDSAPLLVAVALQTGLPFASVRGDVVVGDLHQGEAVGVVGLVIGPDDTDRIGVVLEQRGARALRSLCVLATSHRPDTMEDMTSDVAVADALFRRTEDGRLRPTKEADDVSR